MNLSLPQLLGSLGMAQLGLVAPALEGQYAGGSAATIGVMLLLLAQDVARPQTDPVEWAAIDARLAAIDSDPAHADETRMLLDRLVELTAAAALAMPLTTS